MWIRNLVKGCSLVLAFCASFVMAQQNVEYKLTVNYSGEALYYRYSGSNCLNAGTADPSGSYTLKFTTRANSTVTFYTDKNCNKTLQAAKRLSEICRPGETSAVISIEAPAAPTSSSSVPKSSSSQFGTRSSSSRNGGGAAAGKTVIRFLTPWTNTSAVLFVNGDSTSLMTPVKNYCGWFQTTLNAPASGFNVHFKQTIGLNYVGSEGMVSKAPTSATEISLDSIAALTDTIWIQGYKNDVPALFAKYPGVLGECPLKKFPVTVFDWLHGNKGDGANGNGASTNGVSADFGSGGCGGSNARDSKGNGYMKGMVEYKLGANGVPVPANPFPADCKLTTHLDKWFLPEVIAKKNGVEYTNMTCRDLYISMDNEGFWLAEVSSDKISEGNEKNKGGMFLVDDFEFLDDAQTIKNPYYDWLNGSGGNHNFGFAVKIQATFEYVPGQYFDFYGDDDVWVFIDKRLAVDIGGQHRQVAGAVDLDTMGLKVGETYDFHIFYVERHVSSSNFRMRTSIDLQVDASIFVTSNKRTTSTDYNVWQINKKNKLSCGYDPNNTEVDTTGGASTFRLTGGNLEEPEILGVGTHFEGLKITSDSTFSIDSAAIVDAAALAPGHYFLEISLKSDPSQTTTIEIVIPSYPLPTIAFADDKWKVIGNGTEISGNQATISTLAYEIYPVNITFLEETATVNDYNRKITISASSPLIDIIDKDGNVISKVTLNDKAQATFYIRANGAVSGATLLIKGTAAKASYWKELSFIEPPIPRVTFAMIGDRNGDGRGDSLYAEFDKNFDDSNILDSVQFTFGETFAVVSSKNIKKIAANKIVITTEGACDSASACGFGSRQFTGGENGLYTGNIGTWVTYKENGRTHNLKTTNDPVEDGIGPIIVKATKETMSDGNRKLTLTFSEAITDESRKEFYTQMFQYICPRNGEDKQPEDAVQQGGNGKTATLVFSPSTLESVYPTDGDQIRFTPNKFAVDLNGNNPHQYNPWVIIIGDQELSNESPKVIDITTDNPIIAKTKETTQPILITDTKKDAQAVGEELGVQGNLIDFDISKNMAEQTTKDIAKLDAYITKLTGSTSADTTYEVTEKTQAEAEQQLFADITTDVIGESYGIPDEIVQAVKNGDITASNYKDKIKDKTVLGVINSLISESIENSRDSTMTVTPGTVTGYDEIFDKIASGEITEKDLKKAGISDVVIQAIKDGNLNTSNIEDYRSGNASLISENAVVLVYRTRYYDHLGNYVGGKSGSIKCTDEIYGTGGCLENKGKLFLAWNMRGDSGRLVATGIYIARLEIKIKINGKVTTEQTRDKLMGVRRGKN